MNPHQRNKIDVNSLSAEEQKLFRMYGKLPNKKDLLQNKFKERKYFDSGDYALSQAGKSTDLPSSSIGREHPNPDTIPHLSSSPHNGAGPSPVLDSGAAQPGQRTSVSGISGGSFSSGGGGLGGGILPTSAAGRVGSGSPVKEGSFLHREQSIDDQPGVDDAHGRADEGVSPVSPPPQREGVPILGSARKS